MRGEEPEVDIVEEVAEERWEAVSRVRRRAEGDSMVCISGKVSWYGRYVG